MCDCATPRNGTGYRHNKMICTDGSIAYCSLTEECYASEPFAYGELYDGCRLPLPGNSFVLEAPIFMKPSEEFNDQFFVTFNCYMSYSLCLQNVQVLGIGLVAIRYAICFQIMM